MRGQIGQAGAEAVIPGKKNRTAPPEQDTEMYQERIQFERAINGFKYFRAVAALLISGPPTILLPAA